MDARSSSTRAEAAHKELLAEVKGLRAAVRGLQACCSDDGSDIKELRADFEAGARASRGHLFSKADPLPPCRPATQHACVDANRCLPPALEQPGVVRS
eukprot:13599462-Alexandrium_andersonii.AAC.1